MLKRNNSAVRVGYLAVIEHLQKYIQNIGVRLFYLVEKNDGVRLAAYFFRQLSRFVITHISRRRTDNSRHGVLFHKLTHIKTDKRFGRIEQFFRKYLYKFGLSDARGTRENKRDRSLSGNKADTSATNGVRDGFYRLILSDYTGAERRFEIFQFLGLARLYRR